jgi:signal peptidase II
MTAVSSVSSCMHWIRGCIIILLLTILDQGSKSLVLAQLKDHPDISLIPGVLQLRYLVEWPLDCLKVKFRCL